MNIAAIQHRLRDSADADARALAVAAAVASARGAEVVIFPEVPSLQLDGGAGQVLLAELVREVPAFCVVPSVDPALRGLAVIDELPAPISAPGGGVGVVSLLIGDACMDPAELARADAASPALAILSPRSETDLQAEALLEFAIALSDSLAGVIVIAECAGAEALEVGHGGSAIIVLGDVVAEALYEDDVLVADVPLPLPQPSPREPLPPVPPLLAQRVDHHRGRIGAEHGPDLS